jgi:hypothetical protein
MERILLIVLFVILVGYGLTFLSVSNGKLVIPLSSQIASVSEAINNSIKNDFNETGTLVFYPNNIGPVPYIFYQNQGGDTVAKALTFSASAPANFSS